MGDLLRAFAAAADEEPCGVLLGVVEDDNARIREVPEVPNVHPTPGQSFRIAPEDLMEIVCDGRERGLAVLGFWHGQLEGPPFPARADFEGLEAGEALGPDARLLVVLGQGAGRAPVARAFVCGRHGPREIRLGT